MSTFSAGSANLFLNDLSHNLNIYGQEGNAMIISTILMVSFVFINRDDDNIFEFLKQKSASKIPLFVGVTSVSASPLQIVYSTSASIPSISGVLIISMSSIAFSTSTVIM